jgi:amino-acid N-acetyltransferase
VSTPAAAASAAAPTPPPGAVRVRPARDDDVAAIVAIVDENVRLGHLLPRSAADIRRSLASWLVADRGGSIVGIGSLLVMTPVLVEVRSLAVAPDAAGQGVGAALVRGLTAEARRRGFPTIFALTRAVGFFTRLGFSVTEHERFPEKVWRDCVLCPLRERCDETAVVMALHDQAGDPDDTATTGDARP